MSRQLTSGVLGRKKGIDADLQVYLASLTTALSSGQVALLNTFVKDLKSGLKIERLYNAFDQMLVIANETSEAGLKNLVKRAHDADPINTPVFTALEGFTGNATDMYINTNYTTSTEAVNHLVTGLSTGVYTRNEPNVATARITCGTYDGDTTTFSLIQKRVDISGDKLRILNTGLSDLRINYTASNGMIISTNVDNKLTGYRNGVKLSERENVVPTLSAQSYLLLCGRAGDVGQTPTQFSDEQISFFFTGKGFTEMEQTIIYNSFQKYMTANGKQV